MIYEARLAFTSKPMEKEDETYAKDPFVKSSGNRTAGDGKKVYDYVKSFLYDDFTGRSPLDRLNEDIAKLKKEGYVAIKLEYFKSV